MHVAAFASRKYLRPSRTGAATATVTSRILAVAWNACSCRHRQP
jgi:hypothetical protein